MLYTFPHYYKAFQCTAGDCQDTCCAGWAIMIDHASLERYKKEKGPFGNRLFNSIDWKEGSFKQYGHRCAFLNEDNLCDLYTELGPRSLCRTCRVYPRHAEEFEGCRELSLCISCMEAARIVLGCQEPVRFLTREDDREENYEDFDFFLYTKLMDARELIFEILQSRQLSWELRAAECLALSHDLQGRIRGGCLCEADGLLECYRRTDRDQWFCKRLEEMYDKDARFELAADLWSLMREMEILNSSWPEYHGQLEELLYGGGKEAYRRQRQDFLHSPEAGQLMIWKEQLLVYFVYTYFCGAVYNESPFGKMKLAFGSVFLIEEMAQALWVREKKLDLDHMADCAHRYSREMEHSDENKVLLEQRLMSDKKFALKRLLRVLGEQRV